MTSEEKLAELLRIKNIKAEIAYVKNGDTFKSFYLRLKGSKVADIASLSKEIGLKLLSISEPIIYADYGTGLVKIDLMFKPHPSVDFHSLLDKLDSSYNLPLILGVKNESKVLSVDLAKLPHILVAGSTGSGKSMLLHSFINSLMEKAKDSNIEFVMIDPKQIEFSYYKDCKHLKTPMIEVMGDAVFTLNDLICEMESRFKILKKANCRDIFEYRNLKGVKAMSFKVLVIDELADLNHVCGRKFTNMLVRLAQKSRAAGIHIIAATQHPSAKNIPGELKANFPCRIACKVSSAIHSRVILDANGAEKLLGKGDALIIGAFNSAQRFKGPLVNFKEVAKRQKKMRKNFLYRWFGK